MNESKDFPNCFYRVTVKGLCVRDGKLLMVQEGEGPNCTVGAWELPGGGLDFGESIEEGLKREVEEEMGLKVAKISEKPVYAWTKKIENRRGMEWFYVLVLAYRVEFENLDFTPSEECARIKFFAKDELPERDMGEQMYDLKNFFDPKDFPEEFL